MTDWDAIAAAIKIETRQPFKLSSQTTLSGGWINKAYQIHGQDGRHFFVKLNMAARMDMFLAEVAGLGQIEATQAIRVPKVIAHGISAKQSFLVLEFLDLRSRGDAALLGEQLATMHRCSNSQFGFARDNFIGSTVQSNRWSDDWLVFWRERRLRFQLQLASKNGYGGLLEHLGHNLLDALPDFFEGYLPQPSLLHGDLWAGNHAYLSGGTPVIFDPAVYYGDREADLAMTELFGGYSPDFYAAYRASYPLHHGYAVRRDLYNLYHVLNHANMFGSAYVRQAEGMMRKLLADIR